MSDPLSALTSLGREQGCFAAPEDVFDGVRAVLAAAGDVSDAEGMDTLVATGERESRRLARLLGLRCRAAEAVAGGRFPAIVAQTTGKWGAWWTAASEHGEGSAEAEKARGAYLSALLNYDCDLRCRLLDCEAVIREAVRQEKLYSSLVEIQKSAERACAAAIRSAAASGKAPQPPVHRIVQKVQGLRAPILRLQKAHARIAAAAAEELRRIETIKRTNDTWISDLQARTLGDAVQKALKALGIAA